MKFKKAVRHVLPSPPSIGDGDSVKPCPEVAQAQPTESNLINAHKQMAGATYPESLPNVT